MTKTQGRTASTQPVRAQLAAAETTTTPADPQRLVRQWMKELEPELRRAVPKGVDPTRIVRVALTEIRRNPQLAFCTRDSLLGAVMWSAQLGLEIGAPLGQSYIVPFRNKGVLEAQWVLGYTGALALIYRSPMIRDVFVGTVREGDTFQFRRGLEDTLIHEPADFDETRKVTAYYLMVRYRDGGHYVAVMTPAEIERRRKKAQHGAPRSGAWAEWPEEMEKKSVVRAHWRYLPMDVQTARAMAADEAVLSPQTEVDRQGDDMIVTVSATTTQGDSIGDDAHEDDATGSAGDDPNGQHDPFELGDRKALGQTQYSDPHQAVKAQFGRLGLNGRAIAACLEPYEVIEVSALKPEQAEQLASILSQAATGIGQAEVVALVRSQYYAAHPEARS